MSMGECYHVSHQSLAQTTRWCQFQVENPPFGLVFVQIFRKCLMLDSLQGIGTPLADEFMSKDVESEYTEMCITREMSYFVVYPIIGHGHVATKLASFSPRFSKCFYGIPIPATPSGPTPLTQPQFEAPAEATSPPALEQQLPAAPGRRGNL